MYTYNWVSYILLLTLIISMILCKCQFCTCIVWRLHALPMLQSEVRSCCACGELLAVWIWKIILWRKKRRVCEKGVGNFMVLLCWNDVLFVCFSGFFFFGGGMGEVKMEKKAKPNLIYYYNLRWKSLLWNIPWGFVPQCPPIQPPKIRHLGPDDVTLSSGWHCWHTPVTPAHLISCKKQNKQKQKWRMRLFKLSLSASLLFSSPFSSSSLWSR